MKKNQLLLKPFRSLIKPLLLATLFILSGNSNPVFCQNWNEIIKTVASDRGADDEFGYSVAISGDYAIIGAPYESEDTSGGNSLTEAGAAYILKNIAGTWTEVQKLIASDRWVRDQFGHSVAISGDYVIVGAYAEDEDSTNGNTRVNAGSAYIFKNNSGTWTEVQKLFALDRGIYDLFGWSVAISGDYAIVGARWESEDTSGWNTRTRAGSAYIFKNDTGTWVEVQKIVASDRRNSDCFGCSVSLSGDYALVGAPLNASDSIGTTPIRTGGAYIFENISGSWSEVQKLAASDKQSGGSFGYSVNISGDYAIIGAVGNSLDTSGGNTLINAGAAYIYKNDTGSWSEMQKLVASDRGAEDKFGTSVAISGETAIVGAPFEEEDTTGASTLTKAGSAYIFKNNLGAWYEDQKLVASDREAGDNFGWSVAISGDYATIGAYLEDEDTTGSNSLGSSGSAYIFNKSTIVGISENDFEDVLKVYPNPTTGDFSIDLGATYKNTQVFITDITGRLIESRSITQSRILDLSINAPAGIYLVSIQAGNKRAVIRLVKE